MSWFPALLSGGSGGTPDQRSWQMVPFYKGIVDLPREMLLLSWAGEPRLADSRLGNVRGPAEFRDYVDVTRAWLALSDALVRPLSIVATANRSVEEVVLHLEIGGERQQRGAAVVAEWDDAHRLTAVRVYHSTWPLPGHLVGVPVPAGTTVPAPAFVGHLEQARATGDADALLDHYEEDAELFSFDGVPSLLRGHDELRRLCTVPTGSGSRATTRVGAVTDDGHTCAVEYEVSLDGSLVPDAVGVTTYQRGRHGKIGRERRYRVSRSPHLRSLPGRLLEDPMGWSRR